MQLLSDLNYSIEIKKQASLIYWVAKCYVYNQTSLLLSRGIYAVETCQLVIHAFMA